MSDLTFDELLKLARNAQTFSVADAWTQGRTLYGGLTAALLLAALETKVDPAKLLRSLNVAFSAPALSNIDFEIQTELLREGRNIAQWQARLVQDGVCCVQVNAVFGLALETDLEADFFSVPDIPAVDKAVVYPSNAGPLFSQHFQLAQASGDFPLTGGKSQHLGGWMKFKKPPERITTAHIVALVDTWAPAIFMHMKELKAGSTVSWALQFPSPLAFVNPSESLGYYNAIEKAGDGFSYSHAKIWNSEGQLLALSHQTVIAYH